MSDEKDMQSDEEGVWLEDDSTSFCFVITAYNCQDTIAQTLLSVMAQSYDGWRCEIRDDLSTDHTAEQVQKFISAFGLREKMRLVINTEKHGEVRNTLEAAKGIASDEVICRLDGGDWLTDNDGLAMLDAAYRSDPNIACVWSKHRWNFTNQNLSGPLGDDGEGNYEDVYADVDRWCTSHMKTWRRHAMDGIDDANYRDASGRYIMNACDRAVYLPILHKAALDKRRRVFLPACLYHYVVDTSPENIDGARARTQRKTAEWLYQRKFIG